MQLEFSVRVAGEDRVWRQGLGQRRAEIGGGEGKVLFLITAIF